jgi:hypothetical protein
MARAIPYTEKILSTWRTNRLGCYLLNLLNILLSKEELEGATEQARLASRVISTRPDSEKMGLVRQLQRDTKAEYEAGNKQRGWQLDLLCGKFIRYAFA